MVSIQLLCVGKLKEKHFTAACEEYQKRLSAFCKLTVTELPEVRLPENPSQAQIDGALEKEGAAILAKLPKGGKLVALCVEGDLLSSPALAQQMDAWTVAGASHLTFVIGGSCGLSDQVKAAARMKLSMSKMTFPHQLARVVLLEQVYRGYQILSGGKYHK